MKTIKLQEVKQDPQQHERLCEALREGALVCVPCRGTYRILADLGNKDAVTRLIQSKRRTAKAPSLVLLDAKERLKEVVAEVCPVSKALVKAYWPGPLTILFTPHPDLPSKLVKQLVNGQGKFGVRLPADPILASLLGEFGGPVLASSANKSQKHGESSPAQIHKTFLGHVDFFVDAGDLPQTPPSTVVDVEGGRVIVTRKGEIPEEDLRAYGA